MTVSPGGHSCHRALQCSDSPLPRTPEHCLEEHALTRSSPVRGHHLDGLLDAAPAGLGLLGLFDGADVLLAMGEREALE